MSNIFSIISFRNLFSNNEYSPCFLPSWYCSIIVFFIEWIFLGFAVQSNDWEELNLQPLYIYIGAFFIDNMLHIFQLNTIWSIYPILLFFFHGYFRLVYVGTFDQNSVDSMICNWSRPFQFFNSLSFSQDDLFISENENFIFSLELC